MSKWKLMCGGTVLAAAAFAVPVPTFGADTVLYRLVPATASNGDTINGNTVTIVSAGDSITMNIIADVENDDANTANDGFYFVNGGATTTSAGAGQIQGTFSMNGATAGGDSAHGAVTYSSLINSTTSNPGYQVLGNDSSQPTQPSANSLVNSIGGTAPTNTGSVGDTGGLYWVLSSGTGSATSNTTVTINSVTYTEFNLGSITWVSSSATGGPAVISPYVVPRTSGTAATRRETEFVSDGTVSDIAYNTGQISFGSVDVVSVPEPASIGLVGLGLSALALRARRKARHTA